MRKMLSLTSFLMLVLMGVMVMACAPAASTTPGGGTPSVASIIGTWVNYYYSSYTNTYAFGADNNYTRILKGVSVSTNSGAYVFITDTLILNNLLSDGYTNVFTEKNIAFIDGNNLYYSTGNIFVLVSGSGWSGVYKNFGYSSRTENGTNIINSNFMVLTSTTSNITISDATNFTSTNGVGVYYANPSAPPVGTVLNWTNTSSDDWHSFDMGSVQYFLKIGNFLLVSGTNVPALCGSQYVKQ
ncbi:MAG: hypothetical protein A2Y33_01795 [Spirochaetes bacterium GWF1_51_8]|nr:MAG: hypothetical protein A2Y33_01795 [Spirochaetes bacterium GWF1_51_8]